MKSTHRFLAIAVALIFIGMIFVGAQTALIPTPDGDEDINASLFIYEPVMEQRILNESEAADAIPYVGAISVDTLMPAYYTSNGSDPIAWSLDVEVVIRNKRDTTLENTPGEPGTITIYNVRNMTVAYDATLDEDSIDPLASISHIWKFDRDAPTGWYVVVVEYASHADTCMFYIAEYRESNIDRPDIENPTEFTPIPENMNKEWMLSFSIYTKQFIFPHGEVVDIHARNNRLETIGSMIGGVQYTIFSLRGQGQVMKTMWQKGNLQSMDAHEVRVFDWNQKGSAGRQFSPGLCLVIGRFGDYMDATVIQIGPGMPSVPEFPEL